MIKPVARDSLLVAVQIRHAGARYVGKVESLFRAALGRLYVAHLEKAQSLGLRTPKANPVWMRKGPHN
jgi:hypothetical protein